MASLMRAALVRSARVGRLFSPSKAVVRTAGNVHPNPPPVTPVSGPDWEDRGWKDDGFGLGDYPNLPERSYQLRDPYQKYWDQQDRRNFGEPLHEDDDILGMWMPDRSDEFIFPPWGVRSGDELHVMLGQLLVAFSLLGLVFWYSTYIYDAPSRDPAAPKEYPNLYLEMGGDPALGDTAEPPKRIPKPIYF